jgi:hypothetical protein
MIVLEFRCASPSAIRNASSSSFAVSNAVLMHEDLYVNPPVNTGSRKKRVVLEF